MAVALAAGQSKVRNGAWWTLAACMSAMLVSGSLYGFGQWSGRLKEKGTYGYEQEEMEILASASHLGSYIILDSGWLISAYGTPLGLALGCAYAGVGYLALWASVVVFPGRFPFGVMAFLCFLYGHGCGTIDNAVMTQALTDFPGYKGNVVGCIKAWYALSSATMGVFYEAAFRGDEASFLLFLGSYSMVCIVVLVPIVQYTKGVLHERAGRVRCKFATLVAGLLFLSVLFFVVQLDPSTVTLTLWRGIAAITVLAALSFFLLPVSHRAGHAKGTAGTAALLGGAGRAPARDLGLCETLHCLDFWILISILVVGQGNGLMFISNAPQILEAMEGSSQDKQLTSFVAVISIFNSVSRLSIGNGSEWLRSRVDGTWFLVASMSVIGAAYASLYLIGRQAVWVAAALLGFGYGGLWGVQPTIMADLFGPRQYGMKYACSCVAAFFGSAIFNDLLAGPAYEVASQALGQAPKCFAPSCFAKAFRMAAVCDVVAILLGVWLCFRSRRIYQLLEQGEDEFSDEE